jgi:hypothetical protein
MVVLKMCIVRKDPGAVKMSKIVSPSGFLSLIQPLLLLCPVFKGEEQSRE